MKFDHNPQPDPLIEACLLEIATLDLVTKLCNNTRSLTSQTMFADETPVSFAPTASSSVIATK
jgi:hypothetical protein